MCCCEATPYLCRWIIFVAFKDAGLRIEVGEKASMQFVPCLLLIAFLRIAW